MGLPKIEVIYRSLCWAGTPGDDYFMQFNIKSQSEKCNKQCKQQKKSVDPFIISDYFTLFKKGTEGVSPLAFYNIDETSICLDPSRIKLVGHKLHPSTNGPPCVPAFKNKMGGWIH